MPLPEKTYLMPYVNNEGAGQPAQLCSLISAFVVHVSTVYLLRMLYTQSQISEQLQRLSRPV